MTKITLATIKSFIKKGFAVGNLYGKKTYEFDCMTDSVGKCKGEFTKVETLNLEGAQYQYHLGLPFMWVVGGGRNYFEEYSDGEFVGYRVSNYCGSCIVVQKIA